MAVSVTTNKNRLTSNGSTTAFNFTFPLPDSDTTQVKVMLTVGSVDTLQDVSLYSVTATNNDFSSGGTVTFTTAPASGTITIYRDLATTQTSDYVPGGALDADTLEGNLDKLTMLVQEQQDAIDRSIKFPVTDATALTSEIPNSSGRASNTLIFDSSGNVGAGDATTTSVTTGTEGWADTLNSYDQKEWIKLASSDNVTMDATATYSKVNILYITTSTNTRTVTLPAEASSDGRYLAIIKVDSATGTVTINNDADSAVCAKLTKQYEVAHLICDGTNWFLLNRPHNLGDSSVQTFGADGDVILTHLADQGISLSSTPSGTTTGTTIHFKNLNADIVDGETIARLLFQTPSESDGSDAVASNAEIGVKAIENFTASANRSAVTFGFADGGTSITEALRITPEGIKFPATNDVSTDANTLDDYEEGTFTPTFANITAGTAEGRYTKIGRMVYATVFYEYDGADNFNSFLGQSLPFTVADVNACGFVTMSTTESYSYDASANPLYFYLNKNALTWGGFTEGGSTIEYHGRANEIARGNKVRFGFVYETSL